MVENDAVNVTAYIRIYKDPTGVMWHNFIKFVFADGLQRLVAKAWQLQLEEGNWHGRHEESRSHLLSQLAIAIIIFYQCISEGICSWLSTEKRVILSMIGCIPDSHGKRSRPENCK